MQGQANSQLIEKVLEWGENHNLNDPKAQLNKVLEEVGEIAHEITRNRYGEELADAIGDSLVTLIILSGICGYHPMECLAMAYDEIKDRKGITENGTFVKEEPAELLSEEEPMTIRKLIRNRCKCKKCGDIIESKSVHDYVRCKCGAISTDGGLDYIHRSGVENLIPMDEFEEIG